MGQAESTDGERADLITEQNAAYEESLRMDRLRAATANTPSPIATTPPTPSTPTEESAVRLTRAMRTEEVVELDSSFVSTATNNFDGSRLIGEGAFGKVYEGISQSVSQRFAVKRLESAVSGGGAHDDFNKEVEVLRCFQHPHIIRLYGFSISGPDRCLVYELGSQGSLAINLTDNTKEWARQGSELLAQARRTPGFSSRREEHECRPLQQRDACQAY
jgi:hypothetical protein